MTALDGVGLQSSLHGTGKEGGRFLKGSQFPESPLNQHWMIGISKNGEMPPLLGLLEHHE